MQPPGPDGSPSCPACQAAVPDGARFCPSCGHQLGIDAPGEERRVVTVVFADLEGFTTLAERRDPESVKELLDACFERLVPVVEDHGGHVDKVIGDELMAVFGAPVAHEDDPQRAVHAALAFGPILAEVDPSLRLRVGVNTGEVMAGSVGPVAGYTVTGDVVNTAHRLATAAGSGEVLVGDRTRQAALVGVRYSERGALDLKGKADPVRAWVARPAEGDASSRPGLVTPLVGREAELADLHRRVGAAFGDARSEVVTLIGEAGVGKTRLVRELVASIDGPVRVVWVTCPPYRSGADLGPLGEIVRISLGLGTDRDAPAVDAARRAAEEIARDADADPTLLHAQLRALLGFEGPTGSLPDAPTGSGHGAAAPVFAAVRLVLEHLARRSPLLVVVDDANWADSALLRFLAQLPDHLPSVALVVVILGRDDLLERRSARILSGRDRSTLTLEPLAIAPTEALVTGLLDGARTEPTRMGPAALERLVDAAAGNPLVAEQLVRYLVESGGLVLIEDRWQWTGDADGNEAALPDGIRSLIGARLDALPPDERVLLAWGSVFGRRFWGEAVRIHLDEAGVDFDAAADLLVGRGLLESVPDEGYGDLAFRHVLTRDVAYASLPLAERAARHAQVAEWLEHRGPQTDEAILLSQLAHHYERAVLLGREVHHTEPGLAERAVEALLRAARMERRREGLHRAEHWYRRARQLGSSDTELTLQAAAEHGQVLLGLRQLPAAEEVFQDLQVQAGAERPQLQILALGQLGAVARLQGDVDGSRERFEEAARLAATHHDLVAQVDLLRLEGWCEVTAGRPRAAVPRLLRSLSLDQGRAGGGHRGEALRLLGWCELLGGDIADAQAHLWEAMVLASAEGDVGSVGWSFGLLAQTLLYTGRASQALEVASSLRRSAARHLDVSGEWTCATLAASALVALGDPSAGLGLATEAASRFEELDEPWGLAMARVVMAQAARAGGDLDAARTTLREGIAAIRDLPQVGEDARLLAELGRVEIDARRPEAAERHARAALALVRAGIGDHESGLRAAVTLAEVERARGEPAAAELLLEEAAADRAPGDRTDAWRHAALALADVRIDAGDLEGAIGLLDAVQEPPTEEYRLVTAITRTRRRLSEARLR